jgi:hypothetical protein
MTDEPENMMDRDHRLNWHRWVRQFWPGYRGPVEQTAGRLVADRSRIKPHVFRKMALDLMCASFPEDHPPPEALVKLMKCALDLPENHEVGGWAVYGNHDDRGRVDHEARNAANLIDNLYRIEHDEQMKLRELERRVTAQLGRSPDRKSLRDWRGARDYWKDFELHDQHGANEDPHG